MGTKTLPAEVEWKIAAGSANNAGELEGYASVFGIADLEGDVVTAGAFRKTAADWSRASQPLPLTADHQRDTGGVIGSVPWLAEDATGLRFRARFARTQKAQDIRTLAKDGHLRGVSYTAEVLKASPGEGTMGGRPVHRFLNELRLVEVTTAPWPILPEAGVTVAKAVVATPWDGSASRFTPEQYRRSCLIDTGVGDVDSKDRYKLPVKEPNGDVNRNALGAAAAALSGARGGLTGVTQEQKARAARALMRLYGEADMDAPEGLRRMAGMMSRAQTTWVESVQKAFEITDGAARKAAIDVLVAEYPADDLYDLVAADGDAPGTTDDAASDDTGTSTDEQNPAAVAAAYALSLIAKPGPSDETPNEEPTQSLPAVASLDRDRSNDEIARLEAELQAMGGPTQ